MDKQMDESMERATFVNPFVDLWVQKIDKRLFLRGIILKISFQKTVNKFLP